MKRMDNVMTIRLPKEDIEVINQIAKKTDKDKSTTVRELVELGRTYFAITQYKEGIISLGKAAEIAGLTISEMIDLLAKLGIKNSIELEDYLEGQKLAESLFSS
jgi:predicted HTH domain antitoxin